MDSIINLSPFMQVYVLVIVTLVGIIVGSFLNVVALRLISGESLVFPGSKCPKCQTPIKWYDNIPILSFLLLGGKCRKCKESINIQYPLTEISTGLFFLAIFTANGFTLSSLLLLILACCMIVMTITDIKEKLIFDITVVPLIPLGLIYNFFDLGQSGLGVTKLHILGHILSLNTIFISAIIGALIGAAFFEVFSRLGKLMVGEYAFGGGDTLIGAALGAWFGWKLIIAILILSLFFQLIIGIPVIVYNMYKDKDYKSIIFTGVLILSVFIPFVGKYFGASTHLITALIFTFLSFGCAIAGIVVILSRAKERQSFTFVPFGPALVVAGFIAMFYGPQILLSCSNYFIR